MGQRLSPGPVCSSYCLLPLLPSLLHPASAPLWQNAIPPWSPVWGSCFGDPHRAASPLSQASVRSCPASHSTYLTTQKKLAGHRWWLWKKCVGTSHLLWGTGGRGDPHLLWGTGCGCFTLCTCWNVPSFLTGLSQPVPHWTPGPSTEALVGGSSEVIPVPIKLGAESAPALSRLQAGFSSLGLSPFPSMKPPPWNPPKWPDCVFLILLLDSK